MERKNHVEVYLHFVWATKLRLPLIAPEIERRLHGCISAEARRLGCEVLAVGGMPDHVHLAVPMPTVLSPAKLMQQVKGVASRFASEHLVPQGELFVWQEGYGVFSFSRSHLDRVIRYIRNQKQHHTSGDMWPTWGEISDSLEEPDASR